MAVSPRYRARTWLFVDDTFEQNEEQTNIIRHCDELAKIECRWLRFVVEIHKKTGTRLRGVVSFNQGKGQKSVEKILNLPKTCEICPRMGLTMAYIVRSFEQEHTGNYIMMDYERGKRLTQGKQEVERVDTSGSEAMIARNAAREQQEKAVTSSIVTRSKSIEQLIKPKLTRSESEY